jgi:hypothetical protein
MGGEQNTGPEHRIQVECHSGYKAEERPVSFRVGEDKRVVERVIDQWAGEDHNYFKLLADDRRVYIIRYDRTRDTWTLERVMQPGGALT